MTVVALLWLNPTSLAVSNILPGQNFAWGQNVGWLDWRADASNGVVVGPEYLSGSFYGTNLGWVNVGSGVPQNGSQYSNDSAADFGVNLNTNGDLRGLAYGANVGWISFEDKGAPRIDPVTGRFSGFAYGANIGWINLGDGNFGLAVETRSLPGDSDADGLPDAWELSYAGNLTTLTTTGDADGDGASDAKEYAEGTDPINPDDNVEILSFTATGGGATVSWRTQPGKLYRIEMRPDLGPGSAWMDSRLGVVSPDGLWVTRSVPFPAGATTGFIRIKVVAAP